MTTPPHRFVVPAPVAAVPEIDKLARLPSLHGRGVLTDDEFASQKPLALDAPRS